MAYNTGNTVSNAPEEKVQFKNSAVLGKLSDLYQMRIRLCDKEGKEEDSNQVVALATSSEMSLEAQYSTPFEQSNPEHKLPTLMGMLQSGDWVTTLDSAMTNMFGIQLSGDKKESLNALQGRSNLTKTNSTQVFVSSQPVTIPVTLCFSAWEDAKTEVEDQVKLLQQWTLPKELAEGSIVAEFAKDASLTSLFPSTVPPYVAVYYGAKCYSPLLIQSVSAPLVAPMDSSGNRMHLEVQITLVSRTAWDANNITKMYEG